MPRPEKKPPTEGGEALKVELLAYVNDSISDDITNTTVLLYNETVFEFLIDKIAELQKRLDEVY